MKQRWLFIVPLLLFTALFLAGPASHARATNLPPGFVETNLTDELDSPTAMAMAPDGRIFVTEQGGDVRVIKDGTLLPDPFMSIAVDSSGERGLLGIAFDPNFNSNHYIYLYHTT